MEFNALVKKCYGGEKVPSNDPNLSYAAMVAQNLPRGLEINSSSMQFERAVQECAKKKSRKRQKIQPVVSTAHQPADMGANAILEKRYQQAMLQWRKKYLKTKLPRPSFLP